MPVHLRVTPSIKLARTHLYTWVERGIMRVKCPARARSGDERTNHEATSPPTIQWISVNKTNHVIHLSNNRAGLYFSAKWRFHTTNTTSGQSLRDWLLSPRWRLKSLVCCCCCCCIVGQIKKDQNFTNGKKYLEN